MGAVGGLEERAASLASSPAALRDALTSVDALAN